MLGSLKRPKNYLWSRVRFTGTVKIMKIQPRMEIRDRFFYYKDYILKLAAERAMDVYFFGQRVFAYLIAKLAFVAGYYFVNPIKSTDSLIKKIFVGIPKIIFGLLLLVTLSSLILCFFLVGGTIAGCLGLMNIVDYSFKEQIAAWSPLIILSLLAPCYLSEFWLFKMSMLLCFILIMIGFNILYGQCGILTLGHAGFVLLGSFLTAFLYSGTFGFHVSFFIATVISAAVSFLVGLIMGAPSLRIKDYYLVIVTLAFVLALPQVLRSKYLAEYTGLAVGGLSVEALTPPHFLSYLKEGTWSYFYVLFISVPLVIFAYNLCYHSQIGRAFKTIKCDVEISAIFGIPVVRYKLLAFGLSATYASVAGSLVLSLTKFISSDTFTITDSIDYNSCFRCWRTSQYNGSCCRRSFFKL